MGWLCGVEGIGDRGPDKASKRKGWSSKPPLGDDASGHVRLIETGHGHRKQARPLRRHRLRDRLDLAEARNARRDLPSQPHGFLAQRAGKWDRRAGGREYLGRSGWRLGTLAATSLLAAGKRAKVVVIEQERQRLGAGPRGIRGRRRSAFGRWRRDETVNATWSLPMAQSCSAPVWKRPRTNSWATSNKSGGRRHRRPPVLVSSGDQ